MLHMRACLICGWAFSGHCFLRQWNCFFSLSAIICGERAIVNDSMDHSMY